MVVIGQKHLVLTTQTMRGTYIWDREELVQEKATVIVVGTCVLCVSQNSASSPKLHPTHIVGQSLGGGVIQTFRLRPQQRLEATTGAASTALLIWLDGLLGIVPQPPSIVKKAVGQYQEGRRA